MNISTSIRRLTRLFIVLFVTLSAGLVYWQVVVAQQVTENPHNNRLYVAENCPKRGRILDRNGVVLAESVPVTKGGFCNYIRRYHLTDYPSLAGLIGYYVSPLIPSTGIEHQYEAYLNGSYGLAGLDNTINHLLHRPPVGDDIYLTIDTRIQKILDQRFPEEAPPIGDKVFPSDSGSVIVSDPHTGEILGMLSRPTYDPNKLVDTLSVGDDSYFNQLTRDPMQPLLERPIQSCYVPGSIYKTMTLVAALDTNTVNLNNTLFYNDPNVADPQPYDPAHFQAIGPVRVGNEIFGPSGNNIAPYTHIFPVNLRFGYSHSDNIIFAQTGAATGVDAWLKYNHDFYVGRQIPFDLPVRVSTVTPQVQKNLCASTPPADTPLSVTQLAENSFGQGVDFMTPLQMTMFDNGIANDGTLMRPMVVMKIVDTTQTVISAPGPQSLGNPISSTTARLVRAGMLGVVECGSGSLVRVRLSSPYIPWHVIGKTGTGQTVEPLPQSWFITQAPYESPRLTIVAMKEHAGEGAYADGPMLADIYNDIFTSVPGWQMSPPPAMITDPDPESPSATQTITIAEPDYCNAQNLYGK